MKALLGRRRFGWSAAVAVVVVGATLGWALWLSDAPSREREYRAESVCLITGEQGIRGAAAAPVWEGMQRASLETRVQVNFLAVAGSQTAENAATYLAGMLQGRCELVLAVDQAPVAAVAKAAGQFPQQRFAVVKGVEAANVSLLDGTAEAAYQLVSGSFKP